MSALPSPLVTKHNKLIEAAFKLTLAEQRLLLSVLAQIDTHPDKPAATEKTRIEVTAAAIVDLFDLPLKKAYELLKDAADRLYERSVVISEPDPDEPALSYTKTRWVSSVDYLPNLGMVRLHLAARVLPYLTQLAGEFTSYRIAHVAGMTSVYGVRLYELLAQWQFKGEREVSLDWLRQQFRIPDQYREVGDLKKRVIDPAVDQINSHSDLWVKYGQRKAGRTVVALQFQFGPKAEKQVTQEKPGSAPKHQLDRTYIEAHARPGETWEQAIARLSAGETGKLPGGV